MPACLLAYDATIAGIDQLLAGVRPGVTLLPVLSGHDAITSITCNLRDNAYDRLILLGHGKPGALMLGQHQIDADLVSSRAQEFQDWQVRFIDLYSCSTGSDLRLNEALGNATGAKVRSTDEFVGHSDLGGSWEIDSGVNGIVAFSRAAKQAWVGTLGNP